MRARPLLALCGLALALGVSCGRRGGAIATVNGRPVSAEGLWAEMRRSHGDQVLASMIFDKLVKRRARELELKVGEGEFQRLWRARQSRESRAREDSQTAPPPPRSATGAAVTEHDLERVRQAMIGRAGSPGDLERRLRRQGITDEEFERELYWQAVFEKVIGLSVRASPDEIERFYQQHKDEYRRPEQVRVRLMMFDSRANAEQVRSVLHLPQADFGGLAKAFSTDPGTKDRGGDTGWFGPGDYAEAIEERAYKLEEGQISPVFEAPDGWCIVKLVGRRPGGIPPLREVRDRVRARVLEDKRQEAKLAWSQEQWRRSDIRILAPDLKDVAVGEDTEGAPWPPWGYPTRPDFRLP